MKDTSDTRPMRAYGYTRVSTREQQTGTSLTVQTEQITSYCAGRGWPIVETYRDVASGGPGKRRHFDDMVTEVQRRADGPWKPVVVVTRMDRFSRSSFDWARHQKMLADHKIGFVSIAENIDTTTTVGRMIATIIIAFAEMERDLIRERIRSGIAHKKKQGFVYGPVPYGLKRTEEGRLVPAPTMGVVKQIFAWRRKGWSLRKIARALSHGKNAVPTPRGKTTWMPATIVTILRNKKLYKDLGEVKPMKH